MRQQKDAAPKIYPAVHHFEIVLGSKDSAEIAVAEFLRMDRADLVSLVWSSMNLFMGHHWC